MLALIRRAPGVRRCIQETRRREESIDETADSRHREGRRRRPMRLRTTGRLLWFCAVVNVTMIVSGCGLYLHDETAATRAAATRDAWAKVSAEPNTNVALRNLDAVAKEELRIVEDQARLNLSLALQQLVSMKWNTLDTEVVELLGK